MSDVKGPPDAIETPLVEPANDPYGILKNRDFSLYLISRFIASFAQQMLAVAVGWEVYERTNSTLMLGLVGFAQVVPMFIFTLPSGHVADNYSRQKVLFWMQMLIGVAVAGLAVSSYFGGAVIWTFVCMFLFGIARTFLWASSAAFMPQLVPRNQFSKAVAWYTGSFQISAVAGPAAGGALIAWKHSAFPVYLLNVISAVICVVIISKLRSHHKAIKKEPMSVKNVAAGLKFVYQTKIVLGSITLDLFAVLLGGATALLPVYSRDILHVGPNGLGWLQAALPMGSFIMSLVFLHCPPLKKAGPTLLWAVVGFGVATIGFGYSKYFWLSFAMLFICGVTDYISVVIRHTLVQLRTPDEMRGRVSAVNSLFIGTSNQMGEFESGFVAYFTSPLIAVVSGGIGTIIVVALVAAMWPEIRKYGRIDT